MTKPVARAAEIVAWWALCFLVWMATLSAFDNQDLIAAGVAGLPCAVGAVAARRASGTAWRPRLRWLRWLVALPAAVVADSVRLVPFAARTLVHHGGLRTQAPFRHLRLDLSAGASPDASSRGDAGQRHREAAHRALAMLVLSATPGTLVIDEDRRRGVLTVHAATDGRPRIERVVRR